MGVNLMARGNHGEGPFSDFISRRVFAVFCKLSPYRLLLANAQLERIRVAVAKWRDVAVRLGISCRENNAGKAHAKRSDRAISD